MSNEYDSELCRRIARRMRSAKPAADVNVLGTIKGKEHYWFLYCDNQRADALRMIGRCVSNPQLSFGWNEAAVLSQKVLQQENESRNPANRIAAIDGGTA